MGTQNGEFWETKEISEIVLKHRTLSFEKQKGYSYSRSMQEG